RVGRPPGPPAAAAAALIRSRVGCAEIDWRPMASEYVFIDEWDVDAPQEAVFAALADASTYPDWWKPVYKTVLVDGPPEVGRISKQCFKGLLPYELNTTS